MEVVAGRATIDDVEAFVAGLDAIGAATGATVQAFDARYVVDEAHLERAVTLADRAIDRGEAIADDRGVEILCYAAGTRQIEQALTIGVAAGNAPVVVLVEGGDEAAAADAVRGEIAVDSAIIGAYDPASVRAFYDIGDEELAATNAGLPTLVRERVALLVVER